MLEEFETRRVLLNKELHDAVIALETCAKNESEKNFCALVEAVARYSVYIGDDLETENTDKLFMRLQMCRCEHENDVRLDARAGIFYSSVRAECDWALKVVDKIDAKSARTEGNYVD